MGLATCMVPNNCEGLLYEGGIVLNLEFERRQ